MSFYMNFGAINEGEQADAYKKKKRMERREARFDDNERKSRMAPFTNGDHHKIYTGNSYSHYDADKGRAITKAEKNGLSKEEAMKHEEKMRKNAIEGNKIAQKEYSRRSEIARANGKGYYDDEFDDQYAVAHGAINKHLRRHPEVKHECGIFSETCFIDE